MSQIAQQDHLYVNVQNVEELTDGDKAVILEKYKNGTLADVILVDSFGGYSKVLFFQNIVNQNELNVSFVYGDTIIAMVINY